MGTTPKIEKLEHTPENMGEATRVWETRNTLDKFKGEIQSMKTKDKLPVLDALMDVAKSEPGKSTDQMLGILEQHVKDLEKNEEIKIELERLQLPLDIAELRTQLDATAPPPPKVEKKSFIDRTLENVSGVTMVGIELMKNLPVIGPFLVSMGENGYLGVKVISEFLKKGWYSFMANSAETILPAPFGKKMAERASDSLTRMAVTEKMQEVVEGEKQASQKNNIVLNDAFSERAYAEFVRKARGTNYTAPMASLQPEIVAQVEKATIDLIKKMREIDPLNGTEKVAIAVNMDRLTEVDKIVENEKTTKKNALLTKIKTRWNVNSIAFGETASAKKTDSGWLVTLPEDAVTEDGQPKGKKMEALKNAIPALTNATEIKIVENDEMLELDNKGAISLPVNLNDYGNLNTLLGKKIDRVSRLQGVVDDSLPTDQEKIEFTQQKDANGMVKGTLTWNRQAITLEKLAKNISSIQTNGAGKGMTWKLQDTVWEPEMPEKKEA